MPIILINNKTNYFLILIFMLNRIFVYQRIPYANKTIE